jgi:voltage-gated potassium channel
MSRAWLRYVLPAAGAFVLLAGGGFAALEADTVDTYWQGLWWALSLMTTVGFVGEAPTTAAGELISASLMVSGFVLLTMTTAAVASLFVAEAEEPVQARDRAFEEELMRELRAVAERLGRLETRLQAAPGPTLGPLGDDET